jgi:uncharacterized membrane protein YjjP (DUF1212 family)
VPFNPKPLPRVSVEVPMEPRWKVMGAEDAKRLHERAQAQHERFRPMGARRRRRFVRYVLGTAIGFAAIGFLFVAGDFRTIWVHFLVGMPLGAIVAWTDPGDFATGALYAAAGFLATVLRRPFHGWSELAALLMACLVALLMGCIGIALRRAEENKRMDLEE